MGAKLCVGCGAGGAPPFLGNVRACAKCGGAFLDVFGAEPVPDGITLSEGPITRIADAVLAELGQSAARQVGAPSWRPVRNRIPRRGKLWR